MPPGADVRRLLPAFVHWTFRVALFMEFVGHGAFGVMGGKAAWLPYFHVVGIGSLTAWELMPLIGFVDVFLGSLALVRPTRAAVLYMGVWGFWTALLRPIAGEGWWEFIERAGNYGVPFAFLLWSGIPRTREGWFEAIRPGWAGVAARRGTAAVLQATVVLLLVGHAGLAAVMGKHVLSAQWAAIGLGSLGPFPTLHLEAGLDLAFAFGALVYPAAWLLGTASLWKIGCELLWPLSGAPVWELVERGGSYAAPLLLLAIQMMGGTFFSNVGRHDKADDLKSQGLGP